MRKTKAMSSFILFFSVIIVILFILFSLYIYINRESDTSLELFSKVLIAFLAAFIIIAFDILKPIKPDNRRVQLLILRNKEEINTREFDLQLLKISNSYVGYRTINDINIFSRKKQNFQHKKVPFDIEDLDLVEAAFWCWLSKKYTTHWDVEEIIFEGISGGGGSISQKNDAESNPIVINHVKMEELLTHNIYTINQGQFFQISLPSGSDVKLILSTDSRRCYLIQNKFYKLQIVISYTGSSGVEWTLLGNKILESIKKYSNNKDYYTNNFSIEFTCEYSKFFKGNPDFLRQKKWITNLMEETFHNFDWSEIKPKLEKAYEIN